MKLLTTQNYKTTKGEKLGILTGILYLAPAKISGYEVCPRRSEGCTQACLYTAGMGAFSNVQLARINKTKMFFEDRESFLAQLRKDIKALVRKAEKANMTPAIRLNGTSDIEWTRLGIMNEFPDVTFYDYTKVLNRLTKDIPANYHITFSQNESNGFEVMTALNSGFNAAVVFNVKKGEDMIKEWNGYPVYDGDDTDLRFMDPKGGYVIGLRAKGKARKDESGFVIKVG
jgi:Gene product 88